MHGAASGRIGVVLYSTLLLSLAALPLAFVDAAGETKPVRIGLAKTLFNGKTKGYLDIATEDFKNVLRKTSGLEGEVILKYDAAEVAQKLEKKQLDVGVFHGHEFAWLQKKYPDFRPIIVAINIKHEERAYLIVNQKSPAKAVADLRGKKLAMPMESTEACRLFLEKFCTDKEHKTPAQFFSAIEKYPTAEAALDDVARGKADAASVDTIGLEIYKDIRGPVFEKNLKVLQRSNPFPPAVMVCKPGGLDDATVAKFRAGLLKAHETPEGREMMDSWKITAFEPVPKDYAKRLADVLKDYPPPAK